MSIKTYAQAINEATDQLLASDNNVIVIGEGVPDGIFGSTKGLKEKYPLRVWDSPISEAAVTGVVIGAATNGLRPIQVHQRCDFMTLSFDQICNNSAKWFSIFGKSCPLVARGILGRGWGQGQTHSQSFQSLFAAIPGLKVVMPSSPADAKGMLIAAVRDNNPVIILEHRWLFDMVGEVPEEMYEVPLDKAKVVKQGADITIVGVSYATVEALRAAEILEKEFGVSAEVIDLRSCSPIDYETIENSLGKTEKFLFVDTGHKQGSIGHEIVSTLLEDTFYWFSALRILGTKNYPQPTSHFLTKDYYPTVEQIVNGCLELMDVDADYVDDSKQPHDIPNKNYSTTF